MNKLGISAAIALACALMLWFSPPCSIIRSFDNLEGNAKTITSGPQLQAWAMGVLAQYPTGADFFSDRLGTNFPLRSLYHNPAYVVVWGATSNSPAYLNLMWGGGFIGHCGFEIGPTNFVSYRSGHKWQDGVYFWTDQSQR